MSSLAHAYKTVPYHSAAPRSLRAHTHESPQRPKPDGQVGDGPMLLTYAVGTLPALRLE